MMNSDPSVQQRRRDFCVGVALAAVLVGWIVGVALAWPQERATHVHYGDGLNTDAATLMFHIDVLLHLFFWCTQAFFQSGPSFDRQYTARMSQVLHCATCLLWAPAVICYSILAGGGYATPATVLQVPLFATVIGVPAVWAALRVRSCLRSRWIHELWCVDSDTLNSIVPVAHLPTPALTATQKPRGARCPQAATAAPPRSVLRGGAHIPHAPHTPHVPPPGGI